MVAGSGVRTSPPLTVDLSSFAFSSIGFHLAWFEVVLLGAQLFRTVLSFWTSTPFYHPIAARSFLDIILVLKSTLPEIRIFTPASFYLPFAWYTFIFPLTANVTKSEVWLLTASPESISAVLLPQRQEPFDIPQNSLLSQSLYLFGTLPSASA